MTVCLALESTIFPINAAGGCHYLRLGLPSRVRDEDDEDEDEDFSDEDCSDEADSSIGSWATAGALPGHPKKYRFPASKASHDFCFP